MTWRFVVLALELGYQASDDLIPTACACTSMRSTNHSIHEAFASLADVRDGNGSRRGMAFSRENYIRAIEAAKSAGLSVYQTTIYPDGRIVIQHEAVAYESKPLKLRRGKAEKILWTQDVLNQRGLTSFCRSVAQAARELTRRGLRASFSVSRKLYLIWLIDAE